MDNSCELALLAECLQRSEADSGLVRNKHFGCRFWEALFLPYIRQKEALAQPWLDGLIASRDRDSSHQRARSRAVLPTTEMAPQLALSQHEQIQAMIQTGLTKKQITESIGCSGRTVSRIRSNLRLFGTTKAPANRVGRHKKTTPLAKEALLEQLTEEDDMLRSEMINFLRDKYSIEVSLSTISRLLKEKDTDWSRKISGRMAETQNPDLRDLYLYKISGCHS